MISQFFILSPRGDTVITRDYLGNVPKVSSRPVHAACHFRAHTCSCVHAPPCMLCEAMCMLAVPAFWPRLHIWVQSSGFNVRDARWCALMHAARPTGASCQASKVLAS